MGVGVRVGVSEGDGVGVSVGAMVAVGVEDGMVVGVEVGVGDEVAVAVGVTGGGLCSPGLGRESVLHAPLPFGKRDQATPAPGLLA